MLSSLVDFGIAFLVLIGLMVYYGISPSWAVLWLPVFLLLATGIALGSGLWLAALNVRFRDVNYLIPYLTQRWMYLTPVKCTGARWWGFLRLRSGPALGATGRAEPVSGCGLIWCGRGNLAIPTSRSILQGIGLH